MKKGNKDLNIKVMNITEDILDKHLNRLAKNVWEKRLKTHGYKLHASFCPFSGGVRISVGYVDGEGGLTFANLKSKSKFFALLYAIS